MLRVLSIFCLVLFVAVGTALLFFQAPLMKAVGWGTPAPQASDSGWIGICYPYALYQRI